MGNRGVRVHVGTRSLVQVALEYSPRERTDRLTLMPSLSNLFVPPVPFFSTSLENEY